MANDKLGFVGLGIMGKPMATNLAQAGYEVTVYNRTRSKAQELARAVQVQVADSPAEAARSADVVITMVGDTPDVEAVILGENGVIAGARPGLAVVDMSTVSPVATKAIARRLKQEGVDMLDAPVSGGEKGAIEGGLTIMVGGEQEVYERCLPILQVMGKTVNRMGENGAGQTTKLCNQIICSTTLLAVAEGLVYASRAGLDVEQVISALSAGSAKSFMLEVMGRKMAARDFKPGFFVKHEQKDLRLVLEAARSRGVSLPGTAIVHQLFNSIEAEEGGPTLAHCSLIKALEKLAGGP